MLQVYSITKEQYSTALNEGTLNSDYLYFTSDTYEIFQGADDFAAAFEFYEDSNGLPTNPAENRIYINKLTGSGSVHIGGYWIEILHPISTSVKKDDTNPVSGSAVYNFFTSSSNYAQDEVLSNIEYNPFTASITGVMNDKTTKISSVLTGLARNVSYNKSTGELLLLDITGATLGSINLDLERFIKTATYDPNTKKIILTFNDTSNPLEIDLTSLVDTYTVGNTSTVNLNLAGNKITATVKISTDLNNTLTLGSDGSLYVPPTPPTDISHKMDLLPITDENNIMIASNLGNAKSSGIKIASTGTLSDDANTIATESIIYKALTWKSMI